MKLGVLSEIQNRPCRHGLHTPFHLRLNHGAFARCPRCKKRENSLTNAGNHHNPKASAPSASAVPYSFSVTQCMGVCDTQGKPELTLESSAQAKQSQVTAISISYINRFGKRARNSRRQNQTHGKVKGKKTRQRLAASDRKNGKH